MLDFIKIKHFCSSRGNIKKMKRQASEKISAIPKSAKGLVTRLYIHVTYNVHYQ